MEAKKTIEVKFAGLVVATIGDAGAFGFAVHSDADAVRRGLITLLHRSDKTVARCRAHVRAAMRKAMLAAAAHPA